MCWPGQQTPTVAVIVCRHHPTNTLVTDCFQREGELGAGGAGCTGQQPVTGDGVQEAPADGGVYAARARPREGAEGGGCSRARPGQSRDTEDVRRIIDSD